MKKERQTETAYNEAICSFALYMAKIQKTLRHLEDGEVFDWMELDELLVLAEEEMNCIERLRKQLDFVGGYNVAMTLPLQGCRLEEGQLITNEISERMLHSSGQWVEEFPKKGQDCMLYELSVYLHSYAAEMEKEG